MASMQSALPARKVWVGALCGAVTGIVVYIVRAASGTSIPGEISAEITTVLTFIVSYPRGGAETAGWAHPRTIGSAMASEAFLPFADALEAAIEAGATAVIQPGGALRDDEVIARANEAGIAMVFTGMRHFRH